MARCTDWNCKVTEDKPEVAGDKAVETLCGYLPWSKCPRAVQESQAWKIDKQTRWCSHR